MSEAENIFDQLSQGYALTSLGLLVGVRSRPRDGQVAIVLPDQDSAKAFLSSDPVTQLVEEGRLPDPKFEPVEDAWQFMRRAAGEGFCGISMPVSEARDAPPYLGAPRYDGSLFVFMIRIEEASSDLPTLLAPVPLDGSFPVEFLTRFGVMEFSRGDAIQWTRFDLLDQLTAGWLHFPFRDWEMGAPLFEVRSADYSRSVVPKVRSFPLIGDWINIDGGYPLFTTESRALHYIEGLNTDTKVVSVPIRDLQLRIKELQRDFPFVTICINHMGHREDMAYVMGDSLVSVSGLWRVLPDNRLAKYEDFRGWVRSDTIGWSGGPQIQLAPLSRSLFLVPHYDLPTTDSMSLTEAEDWVTQRFERARILGHDDLIAGGDDPIQLYVLGAWDSLTGEEEPSQFDHFLDALAWLSAYEFEWDRGYRSEGVSIEAAHGGAGLIGSNNPERENLAGERFQKGLYSLAVNVIVRGYVPKDSDNLVFLCNAVLGTLHVDFAGYAGDILWACNDEQRPETLRSLEISDEEWQKWSDSSEPYIDPVGESIALGRIEKSTWDLASQLTRHFLSTALVSLEEAGHVPQRDYSGISILFVKSIEVELGLILKSFRLQRTALITEETIHDDTFLRSFVYDNGKTPSLGQVVLLLREPTLESPPLTVELYNYVHSLPNGNFLTSSTLRRVLRTTINKYRNGGAHDSSISYGTCMEALESLVGLHSQPGILAEIVRWR